MRRLITPVLILAASLAGCSASDTAVDPTELETEPAMTTSTNDAATEHKWRDADDAIADCADVSRIALADMFDRHYNPDNAEVTETPTGYFVAFPGTPDSEGTPVTLHCEWTPDGAKFVQP